MRKLLYVFISAILLLGTVTSCKKSFLNTTPLGNYSDADVWVDPNLCATFVDQIYLHALGWPFAIERLSDFCDETCFTPDWGVFDFSKCIMTEDNLLGWGVDWGFPDPCVNTFHHYLWDPLYIAARECNLFFSKVGGVKFPDDSTKQTMIGEVYFLRAVIYHDLAALYGGVPIITKPYGLGQSYNIARNTYEDVINYVAGQCDTAAMYLPTVLTGALRGHATKGCALALKARTLLYAASDLHDAAHIAVYAAGYAHPELLGYTTGNQSDRWTAAKAAAKTVIDMGLYSLYKPTPAPGDSIAQNFVNYFLSYGYETEDILLQYFTLKTGVSWSDYNPALYCGPNGYDLWGNNTPLGEMVDSYEMKDGSAFDWSNPTEAANPYANRDARLYASILYENCSFRPRDPDGQVYDPYGKIQVGRVIRNTFPADTVLLVPGVDTRQSNIEDWNGGYSGYYLRKFVDPTLDPQYVKQDIPFRHMRYAEVLLNYAEACVETGDLAEAATYINMIRTRAGQPPTTATTQADLRTAVRQERRVELAFEDHRFFDCRRWLIGPEAYAPRHRLDVYYLAAAGTGTYHQADGSTWGAPHYSNMLLVNETGMWDNKCYFFPILRAEMNKNTDLIQNPGY
ncbi:MAG: RagB/SusD family nutrient uptake outer membrane protein [Bacteroidales bacterium]|jgi:hypothetical protein